MTEEKKNCGWCEANEFRCKSSEIVATCDFRTLPRNKDAVIERIKQEREHIESLKNSNDLNQETMFKVVDTLAGVNIMIKYLQDEHKMSQEEINDVCGFPELSWTQKMKLAWKMKALQKARGTK